MTSTFSINRYALGALVVLLCCFGLFLLDRETHSLGDLFKVGNLFALVLYFVPTYALCAMLYYVLKSRNNKNSFTLALTIGIPVGFALVIVTLSIMMGRL